MKFAYPFLFEVTVRLLHGAIQISFSPGIMELKNFSKRCGNSGEEEGENGSRNEVQVYRYGKGKTVFTPKVWPQCQQNQNQAYL